MADRVLTLRELNRATLARQMLVGREQVPVLEAVGRLAGLQAQVPNPPYVGLWTRLPDFRREDLTRLMEERRIVRAAMMRSTLHLVTAGDHQLFRPTVQPALVRALAAFFGKRAKGLDTGKLVTAARPFLEEVPRTTGELRGLLSEVEPEADPEAMAYAVRTYLPLVQVPPAGTWGSGSRASYTTADLWLGENGRTEDPEDLRPLLFRYLAAFGPATVMDFQAWSGMTRLKKAVERIVPELRVFEDEGGKELLDLPGKPLPPASAPVPPRFVPEYDNLLLSHAGRTRVISEEYRKRVFLSAGRVRATFLVDGFVCGTWKVERGKDSAALVIEPFEAVPKEDLGSLIEEGERLVRFVEAGAGSHEVRVERP
ncbi:MAG: winged helix DNA-binding domain-containing protein [Rubrobacteraceae bacterium]